MPLTPCTPLVHTRTLLPPSTSARSAASGPAWNSAILARVLLHTQVTIRAVA